MKIANPNYDVQSSGLGKARKFSIEASGKAFKLLSDGLYSNKIKAIIRELACNAYDAHVEAGNKHTPFDIQLPDKWGKPFKIRDYGTGLPPEKVETLYTTYFFSTKTESNDFTGCLGLGSKSPFAYTDNFTVSSYYDGTVHTYSCYQDELGEPNISKVSSRATKERNGLEIQFAVDLADADSFRAEAIEVLKFFPEESFNSNVRVTKTSFTLEFDEFSILDSSKNWPKYTSHAIMGNVAYPIDTKTLADKTALKPEEIELLESGAYIRFNIGDLNITPSRESIGYDPATVEKLRKKIEECVDTVRNHITKSVQNQKSLFHARKELGRISDNFRRYKALLRKNVYWNSKNVELSVTSDKFYVEKIKLDTTNRRSRLSIVSCKKINPTSACHIESSRFVYSPSLEQNEVFIFVLPGEKKREARARAFVRESGEALYYVECLSEADIKRFAEEQGLPQTMVNRPETFLPKKKKARNNNPKGKQTDKLLRFVRSTNAGQVTPIWKEYKDPDIKNLKGYYVKVDRFTPEVYQARIEAVIRIAKRMNIYDGPVYGIRKKLLDRAKRNPKLKEFSILTEEVKKEILKNPNAKYLDAADNNPYLFFKDKKTYKIASKYNKKIEKLMKQADFLESIVKDLKTLKREVRSVDIVKSELPTQIKMGNLEGEIKKEMKAYPLLEVIDNTYAIRELTESAIEEYVELISKKAKRA